jgi:flavin-binding protein dodecin
MSRYIVLLVIPLLMQACAYPPPSQPPSHITSYRDALADAIQRADSVRIIEQSHPSDTEGRAASGKPRRIYQRVDLSPTATASLENSIRSLDSRAEDIRTRCTFIDHHAIEFRKKGTTTSTLLICFRCAAVSWDGSDRLPPKRLVSALHRFLISQGFQPERDWVKLAEGP